MKPRDDKPPASAPAAPRRQRWWTFGRGAAPNPRTVVLLPPLLVPSWIMLPIWLTLRWRGHRPRLFRYPSYRRDIPDNATRLAEWLRGLGVDEVDAVSFSLGSILLRWAVNHHRVPRVRRIVMLGPPNRGAFMADWLHRKCRILYPLIWGRCAMQLRTGPRGLCERAGRFPATSELGVIAGGRGGPRGFNPLIPGDNDFTVGVEETVMPGMKDFALVRRTHTMLPFSARPRRLVATFLETGRFRPRV